MSFANSGVHVPFWALAIAGLGLAHTVYTHARLRPRNAKKVFVLAVGLNFEDEAARDEWIALWAPFALWVKANEPRTLAFELCIADNDPLKVLIHERYVTLTDYAEVHRSSAPFLEFKAAWGKLSKQPSITGQSYLETNLGFM